MSLNVLDAFVFAVIDDAFISLLFRFWAAAADFLS
jgi:hypothetical protein